MDKRRIVPARDGPKPSPGCRVIQCVRIKANDYAGLVERTRRTDAGYRFDYAIVRARRPIAGHGGTLRWMEAVRFSRSGRRKGEPCRAGDAGAWVTSRGRAYARFRAIIRSGRR